MEVSKMKYWILLITILTLISCSTTTKYVTVPMSTPPKFYVPPDKVVTQKDLLKAYQGATFRISEWQLWYNTQVGSNYFTNYNKGDK